MERLLELKALVDPGRSGMRLDQVLANLFTGYSRSRFKEWILQDRVTVNGQIANQPRKKLMSGDILEVQALLEDVIEHKPEFIELQCVYEDENILVINKAAGLVVHPGAGNNSGTIFNGLLYRCPKSCQLTRAGIVHRLDKDTTGLMVIAKTSLAQSRLVNAFKTRQITREYEAIVVGQMISGGLVNEPIGRCRVKRTLMAIDPLGKPAVTRYRISEKYRQHTRLRLILATGRTHQIRVHMAHINHPLLGDPLYGVRLRLPKEASPELISILQSFRRQAMHAAKLSLPHPVTGEVMEWRAPPPDDMMELTDALRLDSAWHLRRRSHRYCLRGIDYDDSSD